jgi:hypothetical protein
MADLFEVESLDQAAAFSLAAHLERSHEITAELRARDNGCLEIRADSSSLTAVLRTLEDSARALGIASLCVRVNGRSYVLECHAETREQ